MLPDPNATTVSTYNRSLYVGNIASRSLAGRHVVDPGRNRDQKTRARCKSLRHICHQLISKKLNQEDCESK
jgi:hypothetical protein